MNIDDLTPGMIIEFVTPSTNAKGGIIDGGGIFGSGLFVKSITRRKSKQIDIVLKNNLGDKTTIKPEWIRQERTGYYNSMDPNTEFRKKVCFECDDREHCDKTDSDIQNCLAAFTPLEV